MPVVKLSNREIATVLHACGIYHMTASKPGGEL